MKIGKTTQIGIVLVSLGAAALSAACGSDEASGSAPPSFASLTAKLDAPTGKLDAATAAPVATEYEKISSSGLGGTRQVQATQDISAQMCTSGGTAQASGTGDGTSGNVNISYNNCCMQQTCCVNGTTDMVFNTDSSGTATYTECVKYDVSMACDGVTATMTTTGCVGVDGNYVYSIEVAGKTYTVSGSYSSGNGTLTITGANGTFTCTYTNSTGSCTGTSGNFTF